MRKGVVLVKPRNSAVLLAVIVTIISISSSAVAFLHDGDEWDFGVQNLGVWPLRYHRTYSYFYCPVQKHHARADMDNDWIKVTRDADVTAKAKTGWHLSYTTTAAYYGHD